MFDQKKKSYYRKQYNALHPHSQVSIPALVVALHFTVPEAMLIIQVLPGDYVQAGEMDTMAMEDQVVMDSY